MFEISRTGGKGMNERIKELMKQSMVEHQFDIRFSPEKFAELIIAECTQVLFNEAERLFEASSEEFDFRISDDLQCCAEQCMDNIVRVEKHFGVE